MFPKFSLIFITVCLGMLVSSCANLINENGRAPIENVSVKANENTYKQSNSGSVSKSIKNRKLNIFKQNQNNSKSNNWVSPVDDAKLSHSYSKNHPTISYVGTVGSEIYAVRSGKVEFSDEVENLGLIVIIKHSNNLASIYINNYRNLVQKGENVKKGQLIAQMGMNSQNPKQGLLNFELRKSNKNINPLKYF